MNIEEINELCERHEVTEYVRNFIIQSQEEIEYLKSTIRRLRFIKSIEPTGSNVRIDNKRLYYEFSDMSQGFTTKDLVNCIYQMNPEEADHELPNTFTIKEVWLTDEEYESLPEAD